MRSRAISKYWEILRPRFDRLRSRLGTTAYPHNLALLLWPVVALFVAILVIRKASTVKDLADLISALAALAWPVIIVSIISWFRPELRAFLSRLSV
jgi:FtsH-binding integral membrane protein